MAINATILLDHLQKLHPTNHRISAEDKFRVYIKSLALYESDLFLTSSKVYIAYASDLTDAPAFSESATLLCIGEPTSIYWESSCNILCFPQNTSITTLLNAVQDIFDLYSSWEYTLQRLVLADASVKDLAKASLCILKNPIAFHDRNHRSIFLVTDDAKRPLPEDAIMEDNEYMPLDESNQLLLNPEYNDLMNHHEPTLLSDTLYSYKTIVQNIFIKNEFQGRICLYNIYRPFRDGDYSALAMLTQYIQLIVEKQGLLKEISPSSIETALSELLYKHPYDQELLDTALAAVSWSQYDSYVCISMSIPSLSNPQSIYDIRFNSSALLSSSISKHSCIIKHDGNAVALINVTKCQISRSDIICELNKYYKDNHICGGISIEFNDLRQISCFYEQAQIAHKYAEKKADSVCHPFDSHILEFASRNCLEHTSVNAYIPEGLYKLIEYDKLHDTDYCHLLKIYLASNMNIAQTTRLLYIHRSTFLYRIQKISQIMECDLDDYYDRLTLQLAFYLLETK